MFFGTMVLAPSGLLAGVGICAIHIRSTYNTRRNFFFCAVCLMKPMMSETPKLELLMGCEVLLEKEVVLRTPPLSSLVA